MGSTRTKVLIGTGPSDRHRGENMDLNPQGRAGQPHTGGTNEGGAEQSAVEGKEHREEVSITHKRTDPSK